MMQIREISTFDILLRCASVGLDLQDGSILSEFCQSNFWLTDTYLISANDDDKHVYDTTIEYRNVDVKKLTHLNFSS